MGKRRTRYSSSLAPEWIVSSPKTETEKEVIVEVSASIHPDCGVSSSGPASSHRGLEPGQSPSDAADTKKRARYKKSLPSDWVASDFEKDQAIESPHLQPLRGFPRSTPPDIDHYDAVIGPMDGLRQSINRSNTLACNTHISLPPQTGGELVTPPAPTEDKKMFIPYPFPVRSQQAESTFQDTIFLNSRSRGGRGSYGGIGSPQPINDTTVSPPISARQSSPATTDSPSYGRDLPAVPPSISPNYSTC